ncbi:MAG: DMT family transporter [Pseudomonadota bacterium]
MSRAAVFDYSLVAILTLLWGSAFVLIEIALPAFSPAMIALLRIAMAAAFMIAFSVYKGIGLPRTRAHWAKCTSLGLFGFALPFTLVSYGQEFVNSATAAILMAFSPIATLVLAHFLTADEKMTQRRLAAVCLGFLGIIILFGGALNVQTMGIGGLALLGAAFSYAVAGLVMKSMHQFSDIQSSTGSLTMAALWSVPALGLRGDFAKLPYIFQADTSALLSIAAMAIGPTGLATILVLIIVRRRGATFSATSNYGVPVVGVLLGAALLGDPLRWNILVTLLLILTAIWLARPAAENMPAETVSAE